MEEKKKIKNYIHSLTALPAWGGGRAYLRLV